MPAHAGIQSPRAHDLDSRFRGNDVTLPAGYIDWPCMKEIHHSSDKSVALLCSALCVGGERRGSSTAPRFSGYLGYNDTVI